MPKISIGYGLKQLITCKIKRFCQQHMVTHTERDHHAVVEHAVRNMLQHFEDYSNCSCLIFSVPAKVTNITGLKTVQEGSNLLLTCKTSGKPAPNITWTKEKLVLQGNTESLQQGARLNIRNIGRNESGTFYCKAYNGFGNPDSQAVDVDVTCKLHIACLFTVYYVPIIMLYIIDLSTCRCFHECVPLCMF